jgi:hypothetical protein
MTLRMVARVGHSQTESPSNWGGGGERWGEKEDESSVIDELRAAANDPFCSESTRTHTLAVCTLV